MKKKLLLVPVISIGLFSGITGNVSVNAQEPNSVESISAAESVSANERVSYSLQNHIGKIAYVRLATFTATENGTASVNGFQSEWDKVYVSSYMVEENGNAITVKQFKGSTGVSFSFPVKAGNTYVFYVNRISSSNYQNPYSVNGTVTYP